MERSITHIWVGLGTAIAGLVLGYSLVLFGQDPALLANKSSFCPMQETCQGEGCVGATCNDKHCDCLDGECNRRAS